MNGHWFCSFCNDLVFRPSPTGRWDLKEGAPCPVCRHNSATWVPHKADKLPPERAAVLFHQLKEAVK